jgi:biotin synthase-like enzyme
LIEEIYQNDILDLEKENMKRNALNVIIKIFVGVLQHIIKNYFDIHKLKQLINKKMEDSKIYINEIIRITYKCNWKCKFCNISKVNNFGENDI